jgi:ketosteroid isomerase-like protein
MKKLLILLLSLSIYSTALAQNQTEKKVAVTDKALFTKIAQMDSALFDAYNSKNLELLKTFFTKDLEWYQDNGGLMAYEEVFTNFQSIFNKDYDLKRNLIEGSLVVHPIKGFGAIEIGQHQFKHIENGKLEVGTFKFLMIWKNDNGQWKISRVVSFDH